MLVLENGVVRVKITDFGLARAVIDPGLTETGYVVGTPMFMSPEQAEGKHIDHRTDLFSLGSVLYTMCTRRHPFRTGSPLVVMRRVCDSTPRLIRELNPDIPEWLIEIIDRLMRKNPADRFQTAQEVSDLLRQHLDELQYPGRSQPNGTEPRRPRPPLSEAKSMPASLDQFLAEVGLVNRGNFRNLVIRLSTAQGPPDVARVAQELVTIKELTPYQAAALVQGKGKELLVGPYVVLDRIGTGGMGMVYKAVDRNDFHRQDRTIVALKVLPPSYSRSHWAVGEKFRCEVESLARRQHPNIVRCCLDGVQEADGVYYLVMEYVDGHDLKFLVKNVGIFPVKQAIECLLQTAKGLSFAHSLQIIHRDIKPAKLMLDRRTNTFRILDFSLARVILPDPWQHNHGDGAASRAIMGTIPYMSPEQATDSTRADARSDIYSLGCTLHFLLTGRPPYTGETWSEMFQAHRQAPIPSLRAARPTVPHFLEDLFIQMLAKDPADRPPTMGSVIAKIETAMAKSPPSLSSSKTMPVVCPDPPDPGSMVYRVFRRLRLPDGPLDFTLLAKSLLLAGALAALLIILIELLLLNAQGAEPITAATEDQVCVTQGNWVYPPGHASSLNSPIRGQGHGLVWLNSQHNLGPPYGG
jgi:serine/threonine protein kinase